MSLTISDEAFNLIVTQEDTGEQYYRKHYTHFEWPGGASGPTIGIGYDCGYCTSGEIRIDWDGIVDDPTIDRLVRACGLRGELAAAFVRQHGQSVTIGWDEAIKEFRYREVPKWINRVSHALPHCDLLSADSLGALVSLSYNRGTGGFNDPHPRDAEMRAIKVHMATQNFSHIPSDIRSMTRLWPSVPGLQKRRLAEANLFEKGLAAHA